MPLQITIDKERQDMLEALVAAGHFPSIEAAVNCGLELLRLAGKGIDLEGLELRELLEQRQEDEQLDDANFRARVEALLARKRREFGIPR